MKQTDIGILLHRSSFSETSWITTFYTQNCGIQKFVFQGGKRKNSNLFPLKVCELTYYHRVDSELGKLCQMDHLNTPDLLFSDPRKHIVAFFVADVIRQTLKTNEKEQHLFSFLQQTIRSLNQAHNLAWFPLRFLADFTQHIGIRPDATSDSPQYFDMHQGDFFTQPNRDTPVEYGEIVAHLFALFSEGTSEKTTSHLIRKQLFELLIRYYSIHIPHFNVGRSLEIIREVID